ncbi:PaaI family thioesterase [Sphingomonas sp.]|uniref:PaaI family thioesterase n=1 Tax=Sphingomonas sp. TaxID=28214 RepID=UPI0025F504C4|nr:PaaI family thioesterase [Sphingomonas sp.]
MDVIKNNVAGLNGLQQLRALIDAGTPPPIGITMGFTLVEIEEGRAVFQGRPDGSVYNPIGSVHGGYAATLLDSACGCAVHSRLSAEQGYTTLELKVAYHRPLSDLSGTVRAEGRVMSLGRRAAFAEATLTDENGRLCASATSTLLVFEVQRRTAPAEPA